MSKRPHDDLDAFVGLLGAPGGGGGDAKRPCHAAPVAGSTSRVTIERTVGGEPEKPILWRPVSFGHDDVSSGHRWVRETCFGCAYGMPEADDSQPALKGLWQLFKDNYQHMCNQEVAKLMHSFYEEEIRQPMLAQGKECPPWTPQQIVEHIELHTLEPTIHASTSIQELKKIAKWLRDQVRVKHVSNGALRVDLKVLRSLLEVEKQVQALYSTKCTRQLFYSEYLKLDERRQHQGRS